MSSTEESESAKATLRDWAQQEQLSLITLSDEGTTLTGTSGTALPGHVVLTISSSDNTKQCQYTVASIFLQIRDPHQGLLPYRSVCKKHKVQDPVKALDKPMILSYFLGWEEEPEGEGAAGAGAAVGEPASQPLLEGLSQSQQPTLAAPEGAEDSHMETEAVEATATTATTDMEVDAPAEGAAASQESSSSPTKKPSSSSRHKDHHQKDRHGKDSKDRHHHRSHSDKENKEKHRSSSKRPHHASDAASPSKRHKSSSTTPSSKSSSKPMTNEQLFSNLNVVVDKRLQYPKDETSNAAAQHQDELEALAIHHALSAEGFQVTPEILALHQDTSQWIASHEIPVGNSASILRATAGRDLKRVLELFIEATTGSATTPGGGKHKSPPSKSKSSLPSPLPPPAAPPGTKPINKYLLGKKPIIIVPKAMSAPISMINAHEFFANAKFVPRDVMLKQQAASGQRRGPPPNSFARRVSPRWLTVTSKALSNAPIVPNNAATGMLEFEIMDNPTSKLGVEHVRDWQRIVAVVSLGQPWQFKDWPGPYGQAVSLFGEHCYGCYIGLEGDSIPPDLSKWNVKKSKLSRDKRSLDSVTHANFWNDLEEWMAIHKPELLPQTPTNH